MISPSPGPTLEIAEAEAEIHVKKSIPEKESRRADRAKVIIYRKKNS